MKNCCSAPSIRLCSYLTWDATSSSQESPSLDHSVMSDLPYTHLTAISFCQFLAPLFPLSVEGWKMTVHRLVARGRVVSPDSALDLCFSQRFFFLFVFFRGGL